MDGSLVLISADGVHLEGELALAEDSGGVVIFAHGSGSGRHSPRNQAVASRLRESGLATLLMDLLTAEEEHEERYTRHHRFDIQLLQYFLQHLRVWFGACFVRTTCCREMPVQCRAVEHPVQPGTPLSGSDRQLEPGFP